MLKINKKLKKKKHKKGKDEELFTQEELEQYKKKLADKARLEEAVAQGTSGSAVEDAEDIPDDVFDPRAVEDKPEAEKHENKDEWDKFKALTAGVDDILSASKGKLEEIKKESFYQRKPPGPSEPERKKPPPRPEAPKVPPRPTQPVAEENFEEELRFQEPEESPEEEEDEDDIFDTTYIDAVTSGEIKLAYIPESPPPEPEDDPFDTSIVDQVIKPKEIVTKDGKKKTLVSLGCAVDVLTGVLDKNVTKGVVVHTGSIKKRRVQPRDLLLEGEGIVPTEDILVQSPTKTALDEGAPEDLPDTAIPVALAPISPAKKPEPEAKKEDNSELLSLVAEFDVISTTPVEEVQLELEEDEDDEFAALAAESLIKHADPFDTSVAVKALGEEKKPPLSPDVDVILSECPEDPFDTSHAENLAPGKLELQIIESEILGDVSVQIDIDDDDFDPRADENPTVTENPTISVSAPVESPVEASVQLRQQHRDLLGGSSTDLANLVHDPIEPKLGEEDREVDPFDTSTVVDLAPGKLELQILEQELLDDVDNTDFDPRADSKEINLIVEENLEVDIGVIAKPLTPQPEQEVIAEDPFDTSIAENLGPGKAELRFIENELANAEFNETVAIPIQPKVLPLDILDNSKDEDQAPHKPLTPALETAQPLADPFDTTQVSTVLVPGPAELRLLESELKLDEPAPNLPPGYSDTDFNPRESEEKDIEEKEIEAPKEKPDFLTSEFDPEAPHRPLSPQGACAAELEVDPFDTSFASTLLPGKTELKLLEKEIMLIKMDFAQGGNPFLMSDEDYAMPAADNSMASNPFLAGDFSMPPADSALNPFLMGSGDFEPAEANAAATNPFAMFGIEEDPPQPQAAVTAPDVDFFGGELDSRPDFYASQQPPAQDALMFSPEAPPPRPAPPVVTAAVPTSLALSGVGVDYQTEPRMQQTHDEVSIPTRPPPPRLAPPSNETVQLIQKVTGTMDANSSELLDRLSATRTPSPTPMRELNSLSPTSDMLIEEPDLMMDTSPAAPPPSANIIPDQSETMASFMTEQPQPNANFIQEQPQPNANFIHEQPQPNANFIQEQPQPNANFIQEQPQPVATFIQEPPQQVSNFIPEQPQPVANFIPEQQSNANFIQEQRQPVASFIPEEPQTASNFMDIFGGGSVPMAEEAPLQIETVQHESAHIIHQVEPTPPPPPSKPDVFGLFGDPSAGHHAPPPRPAPPAVVMQLTPPEEANLIGDLTSPGNTTQTQSTQPPIAFAAEPRRPPPPKVPPRPISPAAPQPPTAFPQNASSPSLEVAPVPPPVTAPVSIQAPFSSHIETATRAANTAEDDEFDSFNDAFAAKFDNAGGDKKEGGDAFYNAFGASVGLEEGDGAWGNDSWEGTGEMGFGGEDEQFDAFLAMNAPPVPKPVPARAKRQESGDSDEGGTDFSVVIRGQDSFSAHSGGTVPTLAPPPKSPVQAAYADNTMRINPFDSQEMPASEAVPQPRTPPQDVPISTTYQRTDSQETPPSPLFDEDMSQPLEEFPRVNYTGDGWEMHLRQPNKKKITGQRFWKKVFVKLVYQGENPVVQLFNTKDDRDPFQELPLQASYSISDIGAQQFDQYGKIFTVKLQFVFYKERPGVRPGQVKKAERITDRLTKFAAYAIQGDYEGVKEFGSDLRKLGLPVEHAPQISQLLKLGSQDYETMKQFVVSMEEAFFKIPAHRDRTLTYKMEEVQITAVDELYLEQDVHGRVGRQIARVRILFLGFINGMPDLELGVNDINRQGKEVVGRHDIIPVKTEEWIRLEKLEFHSCVLNSDYEGEKVIKFKPPDASYIELLRFRVRPPKTRELPLQTKCTICINGNRVELKCDILVPGFSSRKLGQIPCEDIMLRIPIPESWIYLFRIEKHFRYGSVKSAHRRTGKVKGLERILGTVDTLDQSLIEVTSGSAKYEHQHHAIVWRIARLPKEGQGAYTNHELVSKFTLTSFDQIPEELAKYCWLEFTMPSTHASHTTVRSLSVLGDRDEDPPEKCVRHLARCEYRIEIEQIQPVGLNEYVAATRVKPKEEPVAEVAEKESDSDSSS
ncbi:LOW QUALITY PROTEIN: protein stoned-B-like [Cloeon dipterum]|uniref:LOW QUALITY PROTEIN: protein stoned-B-like n=1 Tax=Cloeon dipterum TaxID=197152 RepID=UPI00321FB04C